MVLLISIGYDEKMDCGFGVVSGFSQFKATKNLALAASKVILKQRRKEY